MKANIGIQASKHLTSFLILVALLSATVSPVLAQTKRRPVVRRRAPVRRVIKPIEPAIVYYSVPANSTISVRMNQTITSENARVGDQFTTTVMVPVYSSGIEVIPAGSEIVGRVTTVTRAARKSKAGTIGVHFISLRLPTGITRSMNGDLTDVTTESNINADNEGEVEGRSATRRNVVFIGGGAAAGALIGAIAGGGKGAGIGAGVGAGLGVAGAFFSKGHEAVINSGTEFGVVLNQALSLPKANVR